MLSISCQNLKGVVSSMPTCNSDAYSNGDDISDGDNVNVKVIIRSMIMKKVHPL